MIVFGASLRTVLLAWIKLDSFQLFSIPCFETTQLSGLYMDEYSTLTDILYTFLVKVRFFEVAFDLVTNE